MRHLIERIKSIKWQLLTSTSEINCVFVFGSPRSGTTLIQKVLEGNSKFCSIPGETGMFTAQNIFDLERKHFGLEESRIQVLLDSSSNAVQFFEKCVKDINQNDRIFIEKTPQHVLRAKFLAKRFPKSKMVHVVRDGRDCFCSSKSNENVRQRSSIEEFARYWRKCVRAGLQAENDSGAFRISYERFVSAPRDELCKLMNSLEVSFEENQLDRNNLASDPRAKIKAFEKLKGEIDDQSVFRWRRELSDKEIRKFESIAGDELKSLGYSIR